MAVDTARKRASALGVGRPYLRLVIPTGTIDEFARQNIADSYGGILADAPPISADCILSLVGPLTPTLALTGQLDTEALFLDGDLTPTLALTGQFNDNGLFLVGPITSTLALTGKICV